MLLGFRQEMVTATLCKAQFVDRLAPDAEWRLVHRLANAAYPSVLRHVSRALVAPEDETTWARVIEALQRGDGNTAAENLNLNVMVDQLHTKVSPLLVAVYVRAGHLVMRRTARGRVTKATVGIGFKATNPAAREWAEQQSARMITGVVAETRKAVRAVIGEAFREQITARETATRIRTIVGLTERQALAVEHFREALEEVGIRAPVMARRVEFFAARKMRERAEMIARTEIMGASNAGQVEAWRQAREVGAVDPELVKEWITTPDDRLCPECEPMDGQQAAVDVAFSGGVMNPPLHPSCRCAVGLNPPRRA